MTYRLEISLSEFLGFNDEEMLKIAKELSEMKSNGNSSIENGELVA
jgi:hypothetical protein